MLRRQAGLLAGISDITGLTWYLNPNNRILMTKIAIHLCSKQRHE